MDQVVGWVERAPKASPWTEETVALLREFHGRNLTASQICTELCAIGVMVSRNAVIGKLARLDLRLGKTPGQFIRRGPSRNGSVINVPKIKKVSVHEIGLALPEPEGFEVHIFDLEPYHCRWPMTEGLGADTRYCGHDTVRGLPYCAHHCARAYQPLEKREKVE
jgi:GcrA cell cycle regulator